MLSSLWSEKEETWVSSRVEMRDPRNEVEQQSTLIVRKLYKNVKYEFHTDFSWRDGNWRSRFMSQMKNVWAEKTTLTKMENLF